MASVASATGRTTSDVKSTVRDTPNAKSEHLIEDYDKPDGDTRGGNGVGSKKDTDRALKREDTDTNSKAMTDIQPTTITRGKASKPSTPAVGTFAEAANRSRSTRVDTVPVIKRSHKKGAGAAAAQQTLTSRAISARQGSPSSSMPDDEDGDCDDDDEGELRYCYCHGVSYGEMVACDNDDCPREWFHLECVGLTRAPKGNCKQLFLLCMPYGRNRRLIISIAKWYCEECKENLRKAGKFFGR